MPNQCFFPNSWAKPIASIAAILFLATRFTPLGIADELRLKAPKSRGESGDQSERNDYPDSVMQPERILLPDIGSSSDSLMTPEAERRLGASFMHSVREHLKVIDDALLSEYIKSLGQRLVRKSDTPNASFHFFLVDEPAVNAFAGPSGYIGVYSGLILETLSESELASVLAHEIAHVTQDHLFRAFEKASRMTGPAAILLLGAVLLGATVSSDAGLAAAAGVQAGVAQKQINFTRANEQEADRVGIKILAESGFDPRAMPVFFNRLGQATRLYETNAPEFLRTHPVTTSRIADARGRAETYPPSRATDDLRYHLVRVNLRLRQFRSPASAAKYFEKSLAEGRYRNEDAERYGYVLALMGTHDYALAHEQLQRLLKKAPSQIAFLITEAQLNQATGNSKQATNNLEAALELFPQSFPLIMAYADILLDNRDVQKAKAFLLEKKKLLSQSANFYQLLARAAGEAGDIVEAHQYQAEYYYLDYELEPAIQQLEIALRRKNPSFYQSAEIEARLAVFKREKEALKDRP